MIKLGELLELIDESDNVVVTRGGDDRVCGNRESIEAMASADALNLNVTGIDIDSKSISIRLWVDEE